MVSGCYGLRKCFQIFPYLLIVFEVVANIIGQSHMNECIKPLCFRIELGDGALKDFLESTQSMNPEDRGHALENDEGISKAHEESAQEGQTEVYHLYHIV